MIKRILFGLAWFGVGLGPAWAVWHYTGWRLWPSVALLVSAVALAIGETRGYVQSPREMDKPTTLFQHDAKR